jgi:hypothetical protein
LERLTKRRGLAELGIAGVNTRPLHAATLGVAGNWGSTLRPHVEHLPNMAAMAGSTRIGDQAARSCWQRACYLLDYTYVACPDRNTRALRYRP